jgi:hypothetical protein
MMIAALLQPEVVVHADACEHRQLLAPQPGDAAAPGGGKLDVLRAHQLAPRAQVLTERRPPRHARTILPGGLDPDRIIPAAARSMAVLLAALRGRQVVDPERYCAGGERQRRAGAVELRCVLAR